MSAKVLFVLMAALAATGAHAVTACDAASSSQYRDCVRMVDSLRLDKAGQARVFAADGSEFTAAQALWMKGQLGAVARLCAKGTRDSQAEAARILAEVGTLLKSHQRS